MIQGSINTVGSKSTTCRQRAIQIGRVTCGAGMALLLTVTATFAQQSKPDKFQSEVLPLLNRYCVECHEQGNDEGGIAFDQFLTRTDAMQAGKTWVRMLDVVEGRAMPPEGSPQPSDADRQKIVRWIEDDFYAALGQKRDKSATGVVIRRLNQQEYNNTIRDLVGLDLGLADEFPPDDIGFGYDNIGSALKISPIHIEKYLAAAERAMQAAIVLPDVEAFPPKELIGLRTHTLPPVEAVEFDHRLEPGRYMVDFSLVRVGTAESVAPPRLSIGFGKDRRTVDAARIQGETIVYRFWLTVARGDKQVSVSLVPNQPEAADSDGKEVKPKKAEPQRVAANVSGDKRYGGKLGLHVDSMVVRGPVQTDSSKLPAAHRLLLFDEPDFGDASRFESAEKVISRFASRAFRRPVTADEIKGILRIYKLAHHRGESFERAAQIALTTILVSPRFLYLIEPDLQKTDRQLTEYELATRLSYFLWSTMPDESLLDSAQQGTLRKNLRQQVARMLADQKSRAFVENFTGQWLHLRKLAGVAPDEDMFPDFDDHLRTSMRAETEAMFAHILCENRSVLELIDADYTFVNETLAGHYGIRGVSGEKVQRIALADNRRGGVLTHAGILTLTSNHNRTSPVKRGQWILQQLLGTPPPPPPVGVAQLDESKKAAASASLRERLEIHRSSADCASCHSQMDPMGFALENFDAIGRWRTSDGQFAIDPSGELSGDRKFDDANGLIRLLKATEQRKFTRNLVENLLTYALGRSVDSHDFSTIESIRQTLIQDDFKIQNIIFGIVESRAFQNRGVSR